MLVRPKAFCKPNDDPCKIRLFHICHLSNLPSILEGQALLPLNVVIEQGKKHRSIVREELQSRRDETTVLGRPQGNLHDYVTFYFAARSPMLGAISRADLEEQNEILILVSAVSSTLKVGFQCGLCSQISDCPHPRLRNENACLIRVVVDEPQENMRVEKRSHHI